MYRVNTMYLHLATGLHTRQPRIHALLLLLMLVMTAVQAGSRAGVDLYLFIDHLPASGQRIVIDGKPYRLNREAAVHLQLESGAHRLDVEPDQHLSFHTPAGSGVRMIGNLYSTGKPPSVHILGNGTEPGAAPSKATLSGQPPAILSGTVTSAEDGRPIPGVQVYITGLTRALRTDDQGRYQASLAAGEYALSLLHPRYATQTSGQITLGAGIRVEKNFQLTPAGVELEEFVVLQPHLQGSLAAVMDERRQAATVTDLLGSDQIAASGDSDAASALRRVTGLTLVDGRFIYVRGMGERYSSTLLNGAAIPGPDPTRRVIPLDLFPTAIIQTMAVQKAFSADMPGEFGGGSVDLRTRGIPEENFLHIGVKLGANTTATGEQAWFGAGGSLDWTGFDHGQRSMPDTVNDALAQTRLSEASRFNPDGFTSTEIQRLGRALNPQRSLRNRTLPPDAGLDLALGRLWQAGRIQAGIRLGTGYGQQWNQQREIRREYAASLNENGEIVLSTRKDTTLDLSERLIRQHAFASGGLEHDAGWALNYTALYLRQTTDESRVKDGNNRSLGSESRIRRTRVLWEEQDLWVHQLRGQAPLVALETGHGARFPALRWQYTRARARRLAPGELEYRYDDIDGNDQYRFSTFGDSNSLRYNHLRDDSEDAEIRLDWPFSLGPIREGLLSVGARYSRRSRDASIRRFKYLLGSNGLRELDLGLPIDALLSANNIRPGYFTLIENTQASDAYTASQSIGTRFIQLDTKLGEQWRVTAGLRMENNRQYTRNQPRLIPNAAAVEARLDSRDRLPAMALTWQWRPSMQVRASYGETLARPDFRELSATPFRDPVTDVDTIGNPELQPTAIRNLDLRWEWYPDEHSTLSLAWFDKRFDQPIETILLPGENLLLTLANAEAARNRGLELETRTSLQTLTRFRLPLEWLPGFQHMSLAINLALIESEIRLAAGTAQAQTNQRRPLQGQSPWTANIQWLYDDGAHNRHWALVYNAYGRRITSVGVAGKPDLYEQPFHQLDFIWRQQWGRWKLRLKLGNLLDPAVETLQGQAITRRYRKGRSLSLGLRYAF